MLPAKFHTVFERLQQPVNSTECTIHNLLTNQDAFINELQDPKFRCSPVELYPMSQLLQLREAIPTRMWNEQLTRDEIHALWGDQLKHYAQLPTRNTYQTQILKNEVDESWPLPLFGKRHNSLVPLLHITLTSHLFQSSESLNFLLHAISIIVLQYYLLERNQWLQAVAEKNQPLYDQLSPYICMVFMRYDLKRGCYHIPLDTMPLHEAARNYDYMSLVSSVLKTLAPSINQWLAPHTNLSLSDSVIEKWCGNKLFVTKIQFFVTSRFVHLRVHKFSDALLHSLQIDNVPTANAIVSDGLTKHFKLIKHHKMHELRFHGKDPYCNKPHQYDVRNSPASLMAMHQTRVPTFLSHFHFSPVTAVTTHSVFAPPSPIWTQSNEYKTAMRRLAVQWLFSSLHECSKLIDSTLYSKIRKSLNRLQRNWKLTWNVVAAASRPLSMTSCSLVRVRYAYTIDEYQMITQLAGALQMPREAEHSPLFISQPQWNSLFERVCHQPPFSQLITEDSASPAVVRSLRSFRSPLASLDARESYHLKLLAIAVEPDTFEYTCVLHACSVYCTNGPVVNWWMVWHGLCMVYGNEHESLQNTLQLFQSHNRPLLKKRLIIDYRQLSLKLIREIDELTLHQELRQTIVQRFQFHSSPQSSNQPSEPEWKTLTGIELTRWCWNQLHEEDWSMCSNERQFEIDAEAQFDDQIQAMRSNWCTVLTGFFRLHCPVALIPSNEDRTWQSFAVFERSWPQCTALLNAMIGHVRSAPFLHELETQLQKAQQQEQACMNEMPRATLEAALHVVKTLNLLLASTDKMKDSEKHLLKQLTQLCHFQTNEVGTQQLDVLRRCKRTFSIRMRYADTTSIPHLIVNYVLPELSTVFSDDVLMERVIQVLSSVDSGSRSNVEQFRDHCLQVLLQPPRNQPDAAVSDRRLKLALARAWQEQKLKQLQQDEQQQNVKRIRHV